MYWDAQSRQFRSVHPDVHHKTSRAERRKIDPMYRRSAAERAKRLVSSPIVAPVQRNQFEHNMLSTIAFEDAVERMEYERLDTKHNDKKNGFVYIASHPSIAAPKIGHSRDPNKVIMAANRFCPHRGWKIEAAVYTVNRQALERKFHKEFAAVRIGNSEFFNIAVAAALYWLEENK